MRADDNAYHMPIERMCKNFGLVGMDIQIKFHNGIDPICEEFFMPAKVVGEYKKYIVVEIQPHYNPYMSQGKSKPYRVGVNKTSVWLGKVEILVDGKRFIQ